MPVFACFCKNNTVQCWKQLEAETEEVLDLKSKLMEASNIIMKKRLK